MVWPTSLKETNQKLQMKYRSYQWMVIIKNLQTINTDVNVQKVPFYTAPRECNLVQSLGKNRHEDFLCYFPWWSWLHEFWAGGYHPWSGGSILHTTEYSLFAASRGLMPRISVHITASTCFQWDLLFVTSVWLFWRPMDWLQYAVAVETHRLACRGHSGPI